MTEIPYTVRDRWAREFAMSATSRSVHDWLADRQHVLVVAAGAVIGTSWQRDCGPRVSTTFEKTPLKLPAQAWREVVVPVRTVDDQAYQPSVTDPPRLVRAWLAPP